MVKTSNTLPFEQRESFRPVLGTTKEVAAFLNTKEATVRYWRGTGTGPIFIRVGKHIRYRWADVETWLAQREAASTSAPMAANQ